MWVLTLSPLLVAVLVVLVLGIVRGTRMKSPWSTIVGILIVLVALAGVAAFAVGQLIDNIAWWRPVLYYPLCGLVWVGYTFLGMLVVSAFNVAWAVIDRVRFGRQTPKELDASGRISTVRTATVLVALAALVVTALGALGARNPRITEYEVGFDTLPAAFDGYRIALVSDIHFGPGIGDDFLHQLVDRVNAESPDLVVLAGDLIDGVPKYLGDDLARELRRFEAPDGVVIVTGNHEFYSGVIAEWMAYFEGLGGTQPRIRLLSNDGFRIERGGQFIDVLGINDQQAVPPYRPDLDLAVKRLADSVRDGQSVATDGFRVLVAHRPSTAVTYRPVLERQGVDLLLSGHTHGGQLWPMRYVILLDQPALFGVHEIGGVRVVISRGAGAWGPPVRVGSDPEVPIITLRSGG